MRIALDARTVYRSQRRGTGKNLIDLYRHLAAARPDWLVAALHRERRPAAIAFPDNIRARRVEILGDRFDAWQQWRLPLAARQYRCDLLHCPSNGCPSWTSVPTVVTIHDLIPLDMPEGRSAAELRRFEAGVRRACEATARIICPSSYTRQRLIDDFSASPERVVVIPWAADTSVRRISEARWDDVLEHYNIDKPFVLHFGAAAARKNTRRVIEAWSAAGSHLHKQWRLLVVGLDEATTQRMAAVASDLNVTSSVRLHGFAEESHLPTLLSAASVLAYPSLSEGFGLPILDAWAASLPVLTSSTTSLPEVAGDAAVLVDPQDTCMIARSLSRLMQDSALRRSLAEAGMVRLRQYSWQNTVSLFIQTLEQAVGATSAVAA